MKSSNLLSIFGSLAVVLAASLFAKDPPSQGREVTKLYAEKCASCHGADAGGGSGPSLSNGVLHHGGDDVSIARSIREGFPQSGMTASHAFHDQLNEPEIRGLVVYIHERIDACERAAAHLPAPTPGQVVTSEKASFKLEAVLGDELEEPWALAFLPDGRMLITERAGRLRVVENGHLMPNAVRDTPAVFGGEGGLLDVAVHPKYASHGHDWIYLSYGDKSANGMGMTAVIRGRLREGAFVDQQQIFKADPSLYRKGGQRFGSRLLFDKKDRLYFSVGDRAAPGDEQDLSHPNGKIHRMKDDGGIPKDNPFAKRDGAIRSIWSYGHRNPQGLVFSPETGELWEAEHGPRGGDELNVIQPGRNYGWPVETFGMNYDGTPITAQPVQAGMESPVNYWLPSIAASPIAFYTGDRIPQWKDNLFVGALAKQELRRLTVEGHSVTHQEVLFRGIGRVRDIVNAPDGYLYVILNQPARIMRIAPANQ